MLFSDFEMLQIISEYLARKSHRRKLYESKALKMSNFFPPTGLTLIFMPTKVKKNHINLINEKFQRKPI